MTTVTVPVDNDQERYYTAATAPYQALERLSEWCNTATDQQLFRLYDRLYKRLYDRMGGIFDYPTAIACGHWQLLRAGRILADEYNNRLERTVTDTVA